MKADNLVDAVIIGAGPAGSSAAYWLASAGREVVLLDKAHFPREKTCGDGLTPRALKQLEDMGLLKSVEEGAHRYLGLRVRAFDKVLDLPWPSVPGFPETGLTITRFDLDAKVAEHAVGAGAKLYEHTEAVDIEFDSSGWVSTVLARDKTGQRTFEIATRLVVVADGSLSRVGRLLGAKRNKVYPLGLAVRTYFSSSKAQEPWIESHLDVPTEKGVIPGYGWVFPLGDGRVNVGAGLLTTSARWKGINTSKLLDTFVEQAGPIWGFSKSDMLAPPKGGKLAMGLCVSPRIGRGWCLAGDALGVINPFNGEGISYGYETGRLAAYYVDLAYRALCSSDTGSALYWLKEYERELLRRYRTYYDFGSLFVAAISRPSLMRFAVKAGLDIPVLMRWALAIMANLFNPLAKGAPELIDALGERLAPTLLKRFSEKD